MVDSGEESSRFFSENRDVVGGSPWHKDSCHLGGSIQEPLLLWNSYC